jgi:hypothetical protein
MFCVKKEAKMTRIITFFLTLLFISCYRYFEQKTIKPENIRIPEFVQELIQTEEEEIMIEVKAGDCLSCIVEWRLNEYLISRGYRGMFRFGRTLYDIINSIKTRSGNPDLVYPGEVLSFRLPMEMKILKLDYYHPCCQVYGLDTLKKLLAFYWLLKYNKNVFNCSERASFVEYYLENEGYHTCIVANENHAWCIVEVEQGEWINVQSVGSPPAIGKAPRQYKVRYENIWEAIKAEPNEYDWWNRVKGSVIGRGF